MALEDDIRAPTKFYQEDIVQRISSPTQTGIVLRCWHDAEDLPPSHDHGDPLMRPLERGEVGVSFFPSGIRDILLETEFTLVDRMFQPGDLCKRSIDDVRSGVVTSVEVKGRLEHAISGVPVPGWKSMADVESPSDVDAGDYVAYDNWIGQVVELFDEATVDVSNGQLVRLPELSSRLTVGEKGSDIIPLPNSVTNLFGLFSRPSRNTDTVVEVKHSVLAISWLAINQTLPAEEAAGISRPDRFWYGANLAKLKLVRKRAEQMMRVGDKVILKNTDGLPFTRHGKEGDICGSIEVRVYVVKSTQTTVEVLWQDGSKDVVLSTDLIPYLNPDEYDTWPGDHVIWKSEDEKRAAVVQSVNAVDRTASVRYSEMGNVELVSLLELDPHGTSDWSAATPAPFDGLGVRRGDFVFIHSEGLHNGLEAPRIPRIGEIEPWVREPPIVHGNGTYGGWRKLMGDIGMDIARRREQERLTEGRICRPDDHSFDWFGEVSDLRLDGTVEVTYPSGSREIFPLERLTKLYDTIEQLEDLWGDDMSTQEEHDHDHIHADEEVWHMDEDGNWQSHSSPDGDEGDWEETDEDEPMEVDEDTWAETEPSTDPDPDDAHARWWADVVANIASNAPLANSDSSTVSQVPSSTLRSSSPDVPKDAVEDKYDADMGEKSNSDDAHIPQKTDADSSPWSRFDVLPQAPKDHAFYSTIPSQPSRSFLARLQKEYRALTSSLPDSIVVRAYEDRSDLLRSLIIGPENTPYEDAPFVIDWMLDSNFPQSPPIAYFLSWTNGNGRVNPNLYEEGKVCLSILGTWAGDKSESWSPARSSLLQALVSIQGLVLVKEPWFCEPAYDKLRGTQEGIVNSRLYNEKAYVLSRGFVRRALEIPLGSLEAEINWFYRKQGRLQKVLEDSRSLIEKSHTSPIGEADAEADRDLAVPRLTAGGIITLGRILAKLEALQSS